MRAYRGVGGNGDFGDFGLGDGFSRHWGRENGSCRANMREYARICVLVNMEMVPYMHVMSGRALECMCRVGAAFTRGGICVMVFCMHFYM
jgi:Flp pilus assembly pilin Flp